MASLSYDEKARVYRVRFRFGGRNLNRSLRTRSEKSARARVARIEETLALLDRGLVTVPTGIDPITFLVSDGRISRTAGAGRTPGLSDFYRAYGDALPDGRKELSTLKGEELHVGHFKRLLGASRVVQSITKADLQQYAAKRLKERFRGRSIRPDTVRKELVTFRMLWNWGVDEGLLVGASPTKNVDLPLVDEKPPFMTRSEIRSILRRGGLTEDEQRTLWHALFLEREEIGELLDHVRGTARHPIVYPLVVFVAHTGARRSEIVRTRIEDIDFRARTVLIREKKKSRKKAVTFRRIDMSPLVERTMRRWVDEHPGGHHVFSQTTRSGGVEPLTVWQADRFLKTTLRGSEWSIVRGFHVFRHSFASNLALAGVADKVIDEWMGHQTVEMRQRYRHLFPRERRSAIDAAFGDEL